MDNKKQTRFPCWICFALGLLANNALGKAAINSFDSSIISKQSAPSLFDKPANESDVKITEPPTGFHTKFLAITQEPEHKFHSTPDPAVPKDQGYILAPGAVRNKEKADRIVQSQSSSSAEEASVLTFPEFLQFQQADLTKNKKSQEKESEKNVLDFPQLYEESKPQRAVYRSSKEGIRDPITQEKISQYSPLSEQILNEIRSEVKELSEQRAAYIIQAQCGSKCEYHPNPSLPGFLLDTRMDPFPLSYGFNIKLRDQMISNPWSSLKLSNFYIPSGTGSFIRGFRLNSIGSEVVVPLAGVYSISTTLKFRVGTSELEKVRLKHNVIVSIFATDLIYTERKPSSQYFSIIPQAKQFTVHFSTTLYLQGGQPLAIEVDNASKAKLMIGEESEFSAHLIGT